MTTTTGLILLGVIAVLVAAVGYFAVLLQGTIQAKERHLKDEIETVRGELQELRTGLREVTMKRLPEPPVLASAPGLGRSLNLTKRSQVLRMHQRGSRPGQIAAALELPVNEVELVVKLHKLLNIPADHVTEPKSALAEL